MKRLNILYLNGITDSFSEDQLDCSSLTIAGHAASLVSAFEKMIEIKKKPVYYKLDRYHIVNLDQIVSVRLS